MIYLDNAATSLQKPKEVEEAVIRAFHTMGNPGRGAHEATLQAGRCVYRVREQLAELFHAEKGERIAFTSNATEALNTAIFGLFQALYMANAGGAWDNAKKVVEDDMHAKGTPLHDAVVVGDTVGDPYKDTSSVSLNPIIKFTTLFGLLAVEMAAKAPFVVSLWCGIIFTLIGLFFVWRSFYGMRIEPSAKD